MWRRLVNLLRELYNTDGVSALSVDTLFVDSSVSTERETGERCSPHLVARRRRRTCDADSSISSASCATLTACQRCLSTPCSWTQAYRPRERQGSVALHTKTTTSDVESSNSPSSVTMSDMAPLHPRPSPSQNPKGQACLCTRCLVGVHAPKGACSAA